MSKRCLALALAVAVSFVGGLPGCYVHTVPIPWLELTNRSTRQLPPGPAELTVQLDTQFPGHTLMGVGVCIDDHLVMERQLDPGLDLPSPAPVQVLGRFPLPEGKHTVGGYSWYRRTSKYHTEAVVITTLTGVALLGGQATLTFATAKPGLGFTDDDYEGYAEITGDRASLVSAGEGACRRRR